jgi:hypothetical protein
VELIESGRFYTVAKVDKYDDEATEWVANKTGLLKPSGADFEALKVEPYETKYGEQPGNLLVTVGLAQLTSRLTTAAQVWDNTHVGLAVGDSTTAASIGQTDLVAATNKRYNAMDATYPSVTNGAMDFRATFGSTEGNFAWEEYGVIAPNTATGFAAGTTKPASYVLYNRKVTALGTKASGASWVFTVTITIS